MFSYVVIKHVIAKPQIYLYTIKIKNKIEYILSQSNLILFLSKIL